MFVIQKNEDGVEEVGPYEVLEDALDGGSGITGFVNKMAAKLMETDVNEQLEMMTSGK